MVHLQGTFCILKKRCRVILTDEALSWASEDQSECEVRVEATEVLAAWLCPRGSKSCCPAPTPAPACRHAVSGATGLTVEYCERGRSGRDGHGVDWRPRRVALLHPAAEVLQTWHRTLATLLHGLPLRPRRLVVVVNPVGGKKCAHRIYSRTIAPLFCRANIHTTVLKTTHRGHARELAETSDYFEEVDGVVGVGGDGLVNELVMGLLLRAARRSSLDPHDPAVPLPSTPLRLGIIPGGSTDALCHGTHGTSNVTTAALHIIMGDSRCVDVAAVHSHGRLHNIALTMISYGYFGDVLKTSERWRWMGPSRYLVSGLLQFLRNPSYEGQLKVLTPAVPLAQPYDGSSCSNKCSVCDRAARSPPSPGQWLQFTGKWSVVTSAVLSCACRLTPHGVSPTAHLGDGCTDLILVSGGSRFRILSYLFRTAYTGNALSLNHVTMHRAQEIHFTPKVSAPKSSWNCDGEELDQPALQMKVHCQRVRLFSRGVETYTDESPKGSSCAGKCTSL